MVGDVLGEALGDRLPIGFETPVSGLRTKISMLSEAMTATAAIRIAAAAMAQGTRDLEGSVDDFGAGSTSVGAAGRTARTVGRIAAVDASAEPSSRQKRKLSSSYSR